MPKLSPQQLLRLLRYLAALGLLLVGLDHLQQYYGSHYADIPTIGTLFFVNFVSAVLLAAALVAPLGRLASRARHAVVSLVSVAGMALAAGSLIALFISEQASLFGFTESGYRPVIVVTIALELATTLLLVGVLYLSLKTRRQEKTASPR